MLSMFDVRASDSDAGAESIVRRVGALVTTADCLEGMDGAAVIHLWRIATPSSSAGLADLPDALDAAERTRALAFRRSEDRQLYVARRLGLRRILASYLGTTPGALGIGAGPHGKPLLNDRAAADGLCFNLSHAGDLAVLAIARHVELGVDIEPQSAGALESRLAGRILSPIERPSFERLPLAARPAAFLRCWTRKEAYLKATGEGLSVPLPRLSVSFLADEAPRLLAVDGRPDAPDRWTLCEFEPQEGYMGALAAAAPAVALHWFDLDEDEGPGGAPDRQRECHHG